MDFEKIEQAYELLLENVQNIQNVLGTSFYDALIEQNVAYIEQKSELEIITKNNQELKRLALRKEEWRRAYQFVLIKAAQTEPLQANHQFTPDAIAFLIVFIMEQLVVKKDLDVLEIGSGTGNLSQTLVNQSIKNLDYLGLELDDLLIDLSASMAEVMGSKVHFVQADAVRPQMLKESDVIVSDLPIGYYPDDIIASRYAVASKIGHTYAHHLLMEQGLKYLKQDGLAIFLAPNNLLSSEQGDLLKTWLRKEAQILAIITLPENIFSSNSQAKSLFVLKKQEENQEIETFVYPLQSLQDQEEMMKFMKNFQKWCKESEI
ncbi:Adenine-specific methyltransferase [Streptococcus sp. DD10]|uniref:class I SAM-dependent methyltransferase n=1 Tax=Streptococcus sp. DD10 TaxID=1777878 RepID=UPI000798A89A|nr:class I SAM-dependent methyltransferase [Streptococcus sp. DD10]KXT74454.1 Adenine-specific methyltransferase [Streptococcus sp. DD10]